jgi:septum formation protein
LYQPLSKLISVQFAESPLTQDAIVICSDQVIVCDGAIREKPTDSAQAIQFLSSYRHHPAKAVDGVVVFNTKTGKTVSGVATAVQHFSPTMPDSFFQQLITEGDIFYCAGGFVVERMEEYTSTLEGEIQTIRGLPVTLTMQLIDQVLE